MKLNTGMTGLIVVALAMCTAAPAMAEPPTPFVIGGYVTDTCSDPCNGPWVWMTNGTGESWDAMNNSSSNYYQILLTGDDVNVNNVLRFAVVYEGKLTATERNVTQNDINCGGFNLNISIGDLPGDVNGDENLTTADATIVLQMAVRGEYSEVADVSRDDTVTSLDALMILQAVDTEP